MPPSARNIDPGTTPTAPVAVMAKGGLEFQVVQVIKGELATQEYDSGLVAMPAADTPVTASRVYLENVYLFNATDEIRLVTIQNGASSVRLLDQYPIAPREKLEVARDGAEIIGIRHNADAAGVTVQYKGFA